MARIYWLSNLSNPRFSTFYEPRVQAVSRANGNFHSRWSITNGKKNTLYALGTSEVTTAQQNAVAAVVVSLFTEAQMGNPFSSLSNPSQKAINTFCDTIGIPRPLPTETIMELSNRLSIAAGNKSMTQLIAELDNDVKIGSLNPLLINPFLLPTVIPAVVGARFTRRQILTLAGIMGVSAFLPRRKAHASVVFSDSFVISGGDAYLETVSGNPYPNWENTGENNTLYVNDVNNRVQLAVGGGGFGSAYITAAGIPTGNQKITAQCYSQTADGYANLLVRVASPLNFYLAFFDAGNNYVEIYRYDSATYTGLLTGQSRAVGYPSSCSFQATGVGATISLTAIGGVTAAVTFDDLDAARIISGPPGLRIYENVGDTAWINNLTVDNLVAPPAVVLKHKPVIQ